MAGLTNPVASGIRSEDIDSAFTEMGLAAPLTEDYARLVLAAETATKALNGEMNVFDAATHIRIHLCNFNDPPPELHRIVRLSEQFKRGNAPWRKVEAELKDALRQFLNSRE